MANRWMQLFSMFGLFTFAIPLKAEEKVWYCEMTGFTSTTPTKGVETYENQRFKFRVTPEKVVLRSDGYFGRLSIDIINFYDAHNFNAGDDYVVLVFDYGKFNYVSATFEGTVAVSARCDDF